MYNHPKSDHKAEFIDALREKQPQVIHATENDDELLYLMMGSVGRLADLFKSGDLARKEVYDQCVGIAAAAMSIAIPIDEVVEEPKPKPTLKAVEPAPQEQDDDDDWDDNDVDQSTPAPAAYFEKTGNSAAAKPTHTARSVGYFPLAQDSGKLRAYDAAFFVYKHHSYGMTMKLEGWIRQNAPDFHMFKTCGVDRKDYPLIGLVDETGAAMAFIRCPTAEIRNNCLDFLKSGYPNRVDPLLDSTPNYEN